MDPHKSLDIPKAVRADVRSLLALTASQLHGMAKILKERDTLKSVVEPYRMIADTIKKPTPIAISVFYVIVNLVFQRTSMKMSDAEILAALGDLFPEDVAKLKPGTKRALLEVLGAKEVLLLARADAVRSAMIPTMVSVNATCDVRPVLTVDHKNVEFGVIVALLSIATADAESKNTRRLIFQMSRSSLRDLKNEIAHVEKHMDLIEKCMPKGFEAF